MIRDGGGVFLKGGQPSQLNVDGAHELVRDLYERIVAMLQGSAF
jgi:hypothetical protein